VLTVEAGLDRIFAIERNGRLNLSGYGINILIAISCIGTLVYPFLDAGGIVQFNCIFKSITGVPCPTCGYSTAIGCLLAGNFKHSFLHNPGWIIWVVFQTGLVFIGIKSILTGRQVVIPGGLVYLLSVLIVLTWVAKFIIGSEYY
jgi:hypothetical protein